MSGILRFETKHGVIAFEVDDDKEDVVAGPPADDGLIEKGAEPMTAKGGDIPDSFEKAMGTLKAYAANLEDMIMGLDLTPKEVSVEIGMKLSAKGWFVIAQAGSEAEMKIALTWEPKGR